MATFWEGPFAVGIRVLWASGCIHSCLTCGGHPPYCRACQPGGAADALAGPPLAFQLCEALTCLHPACPVVVITGMSCLQALTCMLCRKVEGQQHVDLTEASVLQQEGSQHRSQSGLATSDSSGTGVSGKPLHGATDHTLAPNSI